jgi:hypothetical protein
MELEFEYELIEHKTDHNEIETQTPKDLPPLKNRKLELVRSLNELTAEYLRGAYKSLFGKFESTTKKGPPNKAQLVDITAEALNFPGEEAFRRWFYTFPPLTQRILYKAAFTDYLPIPLLEQESEKNLAIKNSRYSWDKEWLFDPDLRLDFLPVKIQYGCPVTAIPEFLRSIFILWLVPPALSGLSACHATELPANTGIAPWNNSTVIAEAFPLLCDTLRDMLHDVNETAREKILRNGFKKKEINELRASTGFLPFNLGEGDAPDSVDLAARFILCMNNNKVRRPDDGQEGVKTLVQNFFNKESPYSHQWNQTDRVFLEFAMCIDHLSRTPGNHPDSNRDLPAARELFHDILLHMARDGNWFDADKLSEHIRITGKDFSFCGRYLETSLKVKADTLIFNGLVFSGDDYYEDFRPEGILRYYLLVRPLFKAYCYIFATLGLLEIVQSAPPLARTYQDKHRPFSLYDSLIAVRITEFGRWCLGLTDSRPPKPAQEYQAIADRELFLVTVQGNSFERRVYLDKIGQRLGENRWRISPASFISGCANKRQITERVERFKALIDRKPAPHWEQLFQKVLDRAGIFDTHRPDILIYNLPQDEALLQELLEDPELRQITRRVEGRMLAVAARDQRKFFALLNEHGIAHF